MDDNIEYEEIDYIPYKDGYITHIHIKFKDKKEDTYEFKQKIRNDSISETEPKSENG